MLSDTDQSPGPASKVETGRIRQIKAKARVFGNYESPDKPFVRLASDWCTPASKGICGAWIAAYAAEKDNQALSEPVLSHAPPGYRQAAETLAACAGISRQTAKTYAGFAWNSTGLSRALNFAERL